MTLYAWYENLSSLIHFDVFDVVTVRRNGKELLAIFLR
jgi:hypothetical protein